MNDQEIFELLVENGFDFLEKAVSELEEYPKYSIINFHAAVELFLKARLMVEHWSLVIAKGKDPNLERFIAGDFQSVTLSDAAVRLEKVVGSGLSESELQAFKEVTRHRNQMIHFFHQSATGESGKSLKRDIVRQHLVAWYYLHGLLAKKWRKVFSKWADKIEKIDKQLLSLHEFLDVVFNNLKETLSGLEKAGMICEDCPSCGFKALIHVNQLKRVYTGECHVCRFKSPYLKIECVDCGEPVYFQGEGFSECGTCGETFDPESLADLLIDSGSAHAAAMDGDSSWDRGNCGVCGDIHTVVRTVGENWICTNCFMELDHEEMQVCGWCNEPNTTDMDGSYWRGCSACDGKAGSMKDD